MVWMGEARLGSARQRKEGEVGWVGSKHLAHFLPTHTGDTAAQLESTTEGGNQ